jgi:RHS repeat-associated protein
VYFTPNVLASGSSGPFTWFGTLAENGAGSTGLLYRRNRYFDPVSGRFTQADPIGLAGGLNLYGFANGDPVNFSDPFGLCPFCVAGYVLFEAGSAAYDAYETYRAFRRSPGEGADALQASLIGAIVPGPGNAYRKGGEVLTRFGSGAEAAVDLGRQAAAAERAGLPHGVSVTARRTSHGSTADRDAVEQHFPVHNTPTRRDRNHRTVELPKPVTDEVATLFNRLFGRSP